MDTQLPRYEIFEQERAGQPHRNTGSVHAADAEMALLNARDVFARRPTCLSLWVVPAAAIYSRTAEELASAVSNPQSPIAHVSPPPSHRSVYQVFTKPTHRQSETFVAHLGQVEAHTPAEALALAQAQFPDQPALVWWVVPAAAIIRSDPADAPSLFAPAADKPYRSPNFYHTLTLMREVRAEANPPEPAPHTTPHAPPDAP